MRKANILVIMSMLVSLCVAACTEDGPITNPQPEIPTPVEKKTGMACGADVSWVTQLEHEGVKFYTPDEAHQEMELMQLLRDYCGVDAIRLRVWVNPERSMEYSPADNVDGWCNIDDVVTKARRAERLGLRTMIDFHFSDTWADPGRQYIPVAWADLSFVDLKMAVASHVRQTMIALQKAGVEPEWVQLGNEVTHGMMKPAGEMDGNAAQFVQLFMAGSEAAKAIFPEIKTIVHLDNGDNIWAYERMCNAFIDNQGDFDMIGMSLYPKMRVDQGDYTTCEAVVEQCLANVNALKGQYGKPVMICEFGMPYNQPEECSRLMTKLLNGPIEGVFYWEPQGKGDMENRIFIDGVPTNAFDAFRNH